MLILLAALSGTADARSNNPARPNRTHASSGRSSNRASSARSNGRSSNRASSRASRPARSHYSYTVSRAARPWSPSWRPPARSGYSWVTGVYVGSAWQPGYWVPTTARVGYTWVPGYWDGVYWVDGRWRPTTQPGYVWVDGYYNGSVYVAGFWRHRTSGRIVVSF